MWAGYTRVSRVGGRENLISPDLQEERIRGYAKSRGLRVEMLPPELDVSGGKIERPILGEAIQGIESGRFRGLIVAQLDRLSRMDISDALATIKRIEAAGGQVVAIAENFDAGTPEGRMARNVLLSLADMQLQRYRRQFADAKEQAVRRGIWPISRVPLGYKLGPDRKLVPDDPQTVLRAFEARASGASWSQVARVLGLGPTGAARLVKNRVYLGELRMGEWANLTAHEPIVSRSLWEAAQIAHPTPKRAGRPTLLSGLVRCAGCRWLMTVDHSKGNRIYRCFPNKSGGRCPEPAVVGIGVVEPYVEGVVLSHLRGLRVKASEPSGVLDEAQERVRAAEAELAAFQEVSRVSDIGSEFFTAGMRSRVAEVNEARRELAGLRLQRMTPALPTLEWDDLSVEERHLVLSRLVGAVYVRKGRGPGRIRIVKRGYEPAPVPGEIQSLVWEDLPGELRLADAE